MSVRVLSSDSDQPDAAVVAAAAAALAGGGLVVLPTETVYGLACRADDEDALQRLLAVKRRSPEKALAVLVAEPARLGEVAELSPAAEKLARAFMPGPITLVLRKLPHISPTVTGGRETIGARVPDMALTRAILAACDFPVVATSANIAGEPAATSVPDLPDELRETVDLVVDGGPCPGGQASTVVDVTVEPPVVLREGPISLPQIMAALPADQPQVPEQGSTT